jgi:hypothetical protein
MALHIGFDVILANLLNSKEHGEGITYDDIDKYCVNIKKLLHEMPYNEEYQYLLFEINTNYIQSALMRYKEYFREFRDKFYKNGDYVLSLFNDRYSREIKTALEKAVKI